jgi:hypothetical protein
LPSVYLLFDLSLIRKVTASGITMSKRKSDSSRLPRPCDLGHQKVSSHTPHKTSKQIKTELRGPSPRANYTDRATTACRRSDCQLLRIEGVAWSAQRIPPAVFSVFYTGAASFPSSSSSVVLTRLSGPRSRPTTFYFSGSVGNRTRASGSVAKNSDR